MTVWTSMNHQNQWSFFFALLIILWLLIEGMGWLINFLKNELFWSEWRDNCRFFSMLHVEEAVVSMTSITSSNHTKFSAWFGDGIELTGLIIRDGDDLSCLEVYSFNPLLSFLYCLKISILLAFKFKSFTFYGIVHPNVGFFHSVNLFPLSFLLSCDNQIEVESLS